MRNCPFEKRYWAELDDAKRRDDAAGMKWARLLLKSITDQHRLGICACQNRGKDARQA